MGNFLFDKNWLFSKVSVGMRMCFYYPPGYIFYMFVSFLFAWGTIQGKG